MDESKADAPKVTAKPAPPPPGAAFVTLEQAAGLLGVSRRRLGELRAEDPTFPNGRQLGGPGTLRLKVEELLKWADAQPRARFSSIGGPRRFSGSPEAA